MDRTQRAYLRAIEQKLLWLACGTIHHANHLRYRPDSPKIGGGKRDRRTWLPRPGAKADGVSAFQAYVAPEAMESTGT